MARFFGQPCSPTTYCCYTIVHAHITDHRMMVDDNVVWLQVIDFGSSCYETDQLYVYVQSRFYRAPEVRNISELMNERRKSQRRLQCNHCVQLILVTRNVQRSDDIQLTSRSRLIFSEQIATYNVLAVLVLIVNNAWPQGLVTNLLRFLCLPLSFDV